MENKDQATQVEDQELDQAQSIQNESPFDENSLVTENAEVDQTNEAPEAVIEPTPEAPEAPVVEEAVAPVADDGVYVTVTVPKDFKLRTSHDRIVDYVAGIYEMLVEDAEHWFSKAQGVTIYKK